MRVGAREGFPYNSVKLVYWLTVTGMGLIPTFFIKWQGFLSIQNIAMSQF
jgi:hypothetical protein